MSKLIVTFACELCAIMTKRSTKNYNIEQDPALNKNNFMP